MILWRCDLTVASVKKSSDAISRCVLPSVMSLRISRSREDSVSNFVCTILSGCFAGEVNVFMR